MKSIKHKGHRLSVQDAFSFFMGMIGRFLPYVSFQSLAKAGNIEFVLPSQTTLPIDEISQPEAVTDLYHDNIFEAPSQGDATNAGCNCPPCQAEREHLKARK